MTAEEKLTMAVTPQVLEDYHNTKVAPFLNPAIQYFGKSDVYSASETWVGQWIDKKPLYQKVVTGTSGAKNTWTKVVNLGSTNIIQCVEMYVKLNSNSNILYPMPYGQQEARFTINYNVLDDVESNGDIWLNVGEVFDSSKTLNAIVKYTKTTDSPISVPLGDPNEYTTDERWVGMWMGQPLYQKTVSFTTPSNNSTTIATISGINEILFMDGKARNGNIEVPLPWIYEKTSCVGVYRDGNNIVCMAYGSDWANKPGYVTIRYTKTS